eukprot:g2569.t1
MVGPNFTAASFIPYCTSKGLSLQEAGLSLTLREIFFVLGTGFVAKQADQRGRVPVVRVCMLGSMIAYMLQACAAYTDKSGSMALIWFGKMFGGFFGSTMSILMAYIMELSMPDIALMKKRTTLLYANHFGLNLVLAPIGGTVGSFGLNVPFWVATCTGFVGFLITSRYMKEVAEVKGAQHKKDDDIASPDDIETSFAAESPPVKLDQLSQDLQERGEAGEDKQEAGAAADAQNEQRKKQEDGEQPNVWKDKILLIYGTGLFIGSIVASGQPLLLPALMSEPSFGVIRGGMSPLEAQQSLSKAIGTMGIPAAILLLVGMLVGYPKISERVSDVTILLCFGFACSLCNCMMAAAMELWHIALLQGLSGLFVGIAYGAINNTMNPYIAESYKHCISQAKSVSMIMGACGKILGPLIFPPIIEDSVDGGWIFLGVGYMVCFVCIAQSRRMADALMKDKPPPGMTAQQHKETLETGAKPADQFLQELSEDIASKLEKRHYHLWNGRIQTVVMKAIDEALPLLHEWSDEDEGEAHLHDLASVMLRLGMDDEVGALHSRHPTAFEDLKIQSKMTAEDMATALSTSRNDVGGMPML